MKKVKKIKKVNYFNILVLITMILSSCLLLHDLIAYGIIPLFSGKFYMVTYFGLFIDISALLLLESAIQVIKSW